MTVLGTALRPAATKVMLLGSGELGKEVAIECQRLGIETIAVDRYPDAPAMQVAHRAHVINMLHGESLRALIEQEKPDYIVPEIEAIATDTLVELEQAGQKVVPTARAAKLTMNREGIRRLAAEELQLPTSRYRFADSEEGFRAAVTEIGLPCIVKPVMSSSGKGQSFIRSADQLSEAWRYAQQGGRAGAGRVIVEGVVNFDFEITLLTVSAVDGVHFCAPVGHRQEDGDYRESWQPQQMSDLALGLPVGAIRQYGPAASAVILPQLSSQNVSFGQLQSAVGAGLQLRLFGKPEIDGTRRLGVTLAVADSVEEAVARAKAAAAAVIVEG